LNRDIYHRAFVFSPAFMQIAHEDGRDKDIEKLRADFMSKINVDLADLDGRLKVEEAIFERAKDIGASTGDGRLSQAAAELKRPHVIVDQAENRIKPVTLLVSSSDARLRVPNLWFDPMRWSQVYDHQKRMGYVFTQRRFVPLISLAAR